ncbi:MAG: UDP-2,3-diacylglucosamine diphosphatase [Pseudomonadota bacterium]
MAVPQSVELIAPPAWRTAEFISDLHLSENDQATFVAWRQYMQNTAADAVFILGDLFEVWVGDDLVASDPASFEAQCADVLRQTSKRLPVFFMHGNRDFLLGQGLMDLCHATLLADPTVLVFRQQRWLLSHGDALCLADVDYMQFRALVRTTEWQKNFLSKPLTERRAIARQLRQQSEARKQSGADYADLDADETRQWLQAAGANTLIHGHTHKPARHDLGGGLGRVVLSDWDATATPPRAEVLQLSADGLKRIRQL